MPDMINPQKGIDIMNNNSIIITQYFYNIMRREREGSNIDSICNTDWHIYKSSEVFLIIIVHSMELE
jgi:hypothetical protein